MLHIVPTPVGNLEDITLRAIRVLKEADLILAEDTRTSAVLLRHYDIRTPMRAHHRNNAHAAVEVPALVGSGLPCDRFVFEGFLPLKKGRATRLAELAADPRTVIIYESPLRLARTLRQLAEAFGGDRRACVCREISKLHEEYRRGTLSDLETHYGVNQIKGEIVIVLEGCVKPVSKIISSLGGERNRQIN